MKMTLLEDELRRASVSISFIHCSIQGFRTLWHRSDIKVIVVELNIIKMIQFLLLPLWGENAAFRADYFQIKNQQPIFITKQKINILMEH